MKISDINHKPITSTVFPHEVFMRLCAKSHSSIENIKEAEKFTNEQIHTIFITAVKEFVEGKLYTEQLADIANYLLKIFLSSNSAKGNLYEALYAAAELTFYIRTIENTHTLEKFREKVLSYRQPF